MKALIIILSSVLFFCGSTKQKDIIIVRTVYNEGRIVSEKTLNIDSDTDLYLPAKQISVELTETMDSLLTVQPNSWKVESKYIQYKITQSKTVQIYVSTTPVEKIERYYSWAVIGHQYELDETFNRSWFENK